MSRFDEIYRKYQIDIYKFVFKMVRDLDASDDICQEVFYGFFMKMKEVKEPKKYLYQSARNRTIDYIRKEARKTDLENTLKDNASIEERESAFEMAEKVAEKFAKNDIEAFIHVCKEFHGFTVKQIRIYLKDSGIKLTDRQIGYALSEMKQRIVEYVSEHNITEIKDLL